ncbi:hypothetical protein GCM10010528_23710 [Gordonia defluvii]|uniref:Type II toxin-antitoxin system HipA family toxin n=1 Tax=Gordonia defluvii TaxID=283718 RepID=A0ABP6LGX2_9ACTN
MDSTSEAYVWMWLAGAAEPIPAGRITAQPDGLWFAYGRRYLTREDAIGLSPTMPLRTDPFGPTADLGMPGALRDGSPDSWGRRVILNALTGSRGRAADTTELSEMAYLLESGSNRLGAIDFQVNASAYAARADTASLNQLSEAAEIVERGESLPPGLRSAMVHGTSLGGARPKALIVDDGRKYLAKFSTADDVLPAVKAEAVSIELARLAGLDVPGFRLERTLGRDALLIERFDRPGGGRRVPVVSALTL